MLDLEVVILGSGEMEQLAMASPASKSASAAGLHVSRS